MPRAASRRNGKEAPDGDDFPEAPLPHLQGLVPAERADWEEAVRLLEGRVPTGPADPQ
jgi:hypothetical protein